MRLQQWRIVISLLVGWGFYYACRKTFSSTMPHLISHKGYTKQDLGMISSSFSFAYGVNKVVCGVMADHVSPKKLFCSGLMLSGLLVIVFPYCPSSYVSALLWGIVAIVQGFGWPAASKLLKVWTPETLGITWSIISSGGNIAATLSPFIIAYISSITSWDTNYYIIGGVSCLFTLLLMFELKDKPEAKSPPPPPPPPDHPMSFWDLFYSRSLWTVSVIYFVLYMIKYTVCDWGQLYFIQQVKLSEITAAGCIGLIQFGGIIGNVLWGYISDKTLKLVPVRSKVSRAPALLMSSSFLSLFIIIFATSLQEDSSELWIEVVCFMVGVMLDGAVAIVGLTAMSCVPDGLASSAHGLTCAVGQVGGFISGYPFSLLVSSYGWYYGYQSIACVSLLMVVANIYLTVLSCQTHKHVKL